MRVELSRFIESDLDAIANYIAQDNPTRAVSFIREIGEQIRAVGQNPFLYQLRPEVGEGARMAIVGRYVILFRIVGKIVRGKTAEGKTVRIERVVYGGRDLLALFQQEQ